MTYSANGRYVIPLNQVQETVNLTRAKTFPNKVGVGQCMDLRGEVLPIFSLADLLGAPRAIKQLAEATALIFQVNQGFAAVAIDNLSHSQQVVIKPIGNGLPQKTGWVGSCILGDGQPALIINPVDILQNRVPNGGVTRRGTAA